MEPLNKIQYLMKKKKIFQYQPKHHGYSLTDKSFQESRIRFVMMRGMRRKGSIPVSGLNDTITDCTNQPTHPRIALCSTSLHLAHVLVWCYTCYGATRALVLHTRAFQLSDHHVQENQLPSHCNSLNPHERALHCHITAYQEPH